MKKVTLWMVLTILLMLTTDVFSQQTKSIFDELTSTSYDEVDVMIQRYHKLKKEKIEEYNFSNEWELNKLGYQLMSEDRIDDAIKIFQLLIEEFPTSFNPYDSMGEAYMKQGKDKLAIENYQKSLELNPDNQNAYRMMLNMQFENRDKDKFSKVYSKQKYENDLDELAKTLTEVNPSPYKFISKEKFWGDVEDKKKMISDSTTYAEFVWHCSQIVANIGCVHSAIIYYFKQEEEMLPDSLRFPLEVKLIDGRMYVSDPLVNFDKINPKTEIFQINGKSTEEIKALIFPHISTQGTNVSGKRQMFNTYGSAMIA
ncbi:MAG: tetratricopeptide repeat protein, partial [Saprospiraceae bacterium]